MMSDSVNGEAFPLDENEENLYNTSSLISIPQITPDNVDGGCFGSGPGAINVTEGMLLLDTFSFHAVDQLYEVLLQIRKDTSDYRPDFVRKSERRLQVIIVPGVPPLMTILCADPALCFSDASGKTFINPSSRLALKAWCSIDEGSDCSEPMTYEWLIALPGQTESLEKAIDHSPTGLDNIEVAIASDFFPEYPNEDIFFVGLTAINGLGSMGKTMLFLDLNKIPIDGNCSVTPTYGVSMTDKFFLSCEGWQDPEEAGIKHYLISTENDGQEASIAKTTIFDPNAPLELNLATGVHYISVTIEDLWGAKTLFPLPDPVVVDPIDPADFEDFMNSGKLEELLGSGDTGTMLMVLQAQAGVIADSDETLVSDVPLVDIPGLELTPEEEEFGKAVVNGQLKVDSLNLLNSSGAAVAPDVGTAEIVAKTIEALIGEPPNEGEKGDIGLEATQSAAALLQDLANSLDSMDGIAEPSQLVPTMTSMATAIGTLLEGIMGTSNVESSEDSTAEELCSHLVPIDTASADKPGVVEYDTDIGDDLDMKVPEDPAAQKCGGIIDAAKLTGEQVGQDLLNMLSQMSKTLLAKSVVNEKQLIETPTIAIYAKL